MIFNLGFLFMIVRVDGGMFDPEEAVETQGTFVGRARGRFCYVSITHLSIYLPVLLA